MNLLKKAVRTALAGPRTQGANNRTWMLAIAGATFCLGGVPAMAQEATPEDANEGEDSFDLEEIVVTGVPVAVSKLRSSSSVSTLDAAALQLAAPVSAAEALRSIPGIHSEASAGEGNTNMSVRGIPISAGGSRYIGFQEDGIPVLLNGDYNFVTPDMYLRVDNSLDHIEAVRGGGAGISGYNSAGALINFITKDGSDEGGSVGISSGLDYQQVRLDWDYGQKLSENTRFFIGGFYREGEGIRNGGLPVESGYQVRANITHEFGDNGSYVRLSLKRLDDNARLEMGGSYRLSHNNPTKANPAEVQQAPGFDPRYASYNSPWMPAVVGRDFSNNLTYHDPNGGLVTEETSFGVKVHLALGNDWVLEDNFRTASRSGAFDVGIGIGNGTSVAAPAGSVYAYGPNAGAAYNGNVMRIAVFDTTFDDLGSTGNTLKLSKQFDFSGGTFTPIVGLDTYRQKVRVLQNMPHYQLTETDDEPIPVATPGMTDATGQFAYGTSWGLGGRDLDYVMSSPYFNFALEAGNLNIDGGVRFDDEQVTGRNYGSSAAPGASLANNLPNELNANTSPVNYDVDHTEYSLGGNYQFTEQVAAFARYSSSASFNVVERLPGSVPVDGSGEVPVNEVETIDVGVKLRFGNFQAFISGFNVKTAEGNVDITTGAQTFTDYETNGVEIEGGYASDGGFALNGSFTILDPKIENDNGAGNVGNQPNRMPKWQFQLNPTYSTGNLKLGLSIYGQDDAFANDANSIILPSYTTIGLFASYSFTENASFSVSANNLTNEIGWTEMNGGPGGGPEARSINGRSVKASLRYTF